jgi:hypothetical protein
MLAASKSKCNPGVGSSSESTVSEVSLTILAVSFKQGAIIQDF